MDYFERTANPDHIEYWYDKHTKLWVIQIIADDGFELIDGDYEYRDHIYHKNVRDLIIKQWCDEYGIKAIKL